MASLLEPATKMKLALICSNNGKEQVYLKLPQR